MSKFAFIPLMGFLAWFSAVASPATAAQSTATTTQTTVKSSGAKPHPGAAAHSAGTAAQSENFTVSQLGHAVGTAEFRFSPSAAGYDSTSTVRVSIHASGQGPASGQGLDYALSKTEQLDQARHLQHVLLSATVNGQAVNVTGKPDPTHFLLNISANGRSSTTPLALHPAAVFLPDFDPGGLETLLALAAAQNNRDLWAIVPKLAGSVEPIQLATYADERGVLDGKPIAVHHLVATIAGASTDLFSGPDNQLLQAELPQQGFSLVRKGFVLTPPKKPIAPPEQ